IGAQTAVDQAKASLKFTEANVLQSQIQEQNVKQAEILIQSARDMVELLKSQIRDAKIVAPIDGVITNKVVEVGELAIPGTIIVTISRLDMVYLTIFIPETKLGMVNLGKEAQITVDSFPNRVFKGKVTYISSKAEYTPKNIQTKDERIKLVYGVKIAIENPDKSLKQGMPADAVLKI
ncbi:HlyD family efflux transporter periplasmic adaptor subunit, partial [Candidatus Poribacteria bacterium]|nr:HlyD family efflux transporter periplasmic adaptor subunit [Candidatus Poribacteria bacterium]